MSQTTIQTYREIGLVYLDTDGCNTNFFSVAHARDSPIPSEQGYLSLLSLLYHVFNLQYRLEERVKNLSEELDELKADLK